MAFYFAAPVFASAVMSRQVADTNLGIVVVFNFLEDLKRRKAAK